MRGLLGLPSIPEEHFTCTECKTDGRVTGASWMSRRGFGCSECAPENRDAMFLDMADPTPIGELS